MEFLPGYERYDFDSDNVIVQAITRGGEKIKCIISSNAIADYLHFEGLEFDALAAYRENRVAFEAAFEERAERGLFSAPGVITIETLDLNA